MPTPDFILSLRERVGHELLWMPGVAAVVFNQASEVLLCRRTDNGSWTIITGILEPGEEPGPGLLREIEEETGVKARLEHLIQVGVTDPVTFPNQDRCQFLNLVFRCAYVSGTARVNDDESSDVRWFALDALPELNATHRMLIELARTSTGVPVFETG